MRSALAIFDRRQILKGVGPFLDDEVRGFLLRGVRQLASLLGCEETPSILQYNSVLPYMIQQMEPTKPLAGLTNQQAWACILDEDFWEAACPKRLSQASGALSRIVRFYISIEDGECTVERDLGEFRSQQRQHQTGDVQFHDDRLILRINGPRSVAQFDEGVDDAREMLTPFSRECASLWRQLKGRKRGHYNAQATVAAKRARQAMRGTVSGTFRGVLSVARLAVMSARRRRQQGQGSVNNLHEGAGTSESALWTESMSRFEKRSQHNIPGCVQTRMKPGEAFVNPVGVHLQEQRGANTQPLARARPHRKVAIWAGVAVHPVLDLEILEGRHRCATADVVVVPDLAVLHDVEILVADVDRVVCFLYIVSRGLEVTTSSRLAAAHGRVKKIPTQHRMFHVAVMQRQALFHVGQCSEKSIAMFIGRCGA